MMEAVCVNYDVVPYAILTMVLVVLTAGILGVFVGIYQKGRCWEGFLVITMLCILAWQYVASYARPRKTD